MFLTPSARRRARFLAVSFLLVLGTGLLLSTAWQVYHRSAFAHTVLSYRFEYGEEPVTLPGSGQFHDGVPLEEMDFQALGYVPDDNMRRAERYPVESYPLLDDVTYYRRENGRMVRALTLKKGTLLPCEDPNLTRNPKFGYGFYSYPTYEAGWRYAVPFMTAGQADIFEGETDITLSQAEYPFYYVRLEDLETVYLSRYRALEAAGYNFAEEVRARNAIVQPNSPMEVKMFDKLHRLDFIFSRAGIFLSEDLTERGWTDADTDRMAWTFLSLVGAVFCLWRGKGAVRWIGVAAFAAAAVSITVFTGVRVSSAWEEHRTLASVYMDEVYSLFYHRTEPGSTQYEDHVPMEEMDFTQFELGPEAFAPMGIPTVAYGVQLSEDVTYYRDFWGLKIPVKTLRKGTLLTIMTGNGYTIPYGYGLSSFPTYEPGWRYVVPFEPHTAFEADFAETITLSQDAYEYAYIRLDDLFTLLNDYWIAYYSEESREMESPYREYRLFNVMTGLDQDLQGRKYYTSEEVLLLPVFPGDIQSALLGTACLALSACILFRKRGNPL